ncbi:Permease, YjgP/YjgQ family [uncultured Desulfobacterium sp.]|uniref:Permease, YjgP/YjgQ family n=1 Tax=uncultured Desulfobacterium sp. TaxID=201089 RepID=A0A445MX26_9BACT|nr:Permease, YjgP/YjgQ family [uncultured Desulfobacterium sp.]
MQSTLSKYLVREFLKLLTICEVIFVFLYLLIDSIGAIDNLIEANVGISPALTYFAFKIPLIIVQMLPPATLMSIIIMFSLMKKNNHIMLLNGCGLNIWIISRPIIITSMILAVGLFLCSEVIVPYTSSRSNKIWRVEVKKQDQGSSRKCSDIWYRGKKCIYWMRHFDRRRQVMVEPSLYFFDDSFKLIRKIDGREGIWENGKWNITDGIILQSKSGNKEYSTNKFDQFELELPETPDTFLREEKDPEEMGYWQLKRFVERMKQEGVDVTQYSVDLHLKTAFPFIVLLMVVIGVPISLILKKGGPSLAVAIGLFFCVIYMSFLGFFRSLGMAGVIPPVVSVWMANAIFTLVGTYLMMHVD